MSRLHIRIWKLNLGVLDVSVVTITPVPRSYILHSKLQFPHNAHISNHIHHIRTTKKKKKKKKRRIKKIKKAVNTRQGHTHNNNNANNYETYIHYQHTSPSLQNSIPHPNTNTSLQNNIHVSKVHCWSTYDPGAARLPYYYTPPVCVHTVIGALVVWQLLWFLVCYAATQLATQLPQRRIQVVRSNKVARKRLTESNGTPAMDLGHMNVGWIECTCMLECIEDMGFCIEVIELYVNIECRDLNYL